jgi:protein-disulfide isomerase
MKDPDAVFGIVPPLSDRDHIQGTYNARILLMEYGDYQCPRSGQVHLKIKAIQQQFGDQLCFVFRHFPQPHLHDRSQLAAESAEAAHAQGKFWEMHDVLLEHQQALSDADIVQYAIDLNLDIPQFLRELSEHVHSERVQQDVESGYYNGVARTPAFFIGIRFENAQKLDELLLTLLKLQRV